MHVRVGCKKEGGIIAVVGTRPNIVKIAPLYRAFQKLSLPIEIVHTGQHYDYCMSEVFFEQLQVPRPLANLEVGSGTHAWQTAEIMRRFEPVIQECRPRLVMVIGDVNSTLACALVAAKMGIKVAHVEAGLRSFDRSMPEEINRVLTDVLADYLFVTEPAGVQNLKKEGIPSERIYLVGDVLADSLRIFRKIVNKQPIQGIISGAGALRPGKYCVLTLHRPANVDDPKILASIMGAIKKIAKVMPVVFPVHPRTEKRLAMLGMQQNIPEIICTPPLGYIEFISLLRRAKLLLTDSGGAQQEAFILGVPCVTLRDTTERPLTLRGGWNRLVGSDPEQIVAAAMSVIRSLKSRKRPNSPYIDGHAAERIAQVISKALTQ